MVDARISLPAFLAPVGVNGRRQGIEVREKRHRSPDFVIRNVFPGCIFSELSLPGKHARFFNAACKVSERKVDSNSRIGTRVLPFWKPIHKKGKFPSEKLVGVVV